MWINERSEWLRVGYLIQIELKNSKEAGNELYKIFLSEKKVKLNHSNINIEQG